MRPMGRFFAFLGLTLAAAAPAFAQGSTVRGTVTSNEGRPLGGTRIVRAGVNPDTVRADSLGRYVIARLPQGRHVFTIYARGFDPVEMELNFTVDTTLQVDIPLEPARPVAADVLQRVGFDTRRTEGLRLQGNMSATFLNIEDIRSKGVTRTSQLFDGIANIYLRTERSMDVVYGFDQRCMMNVWIDGQQAQNVFPPPGGVSQSMRDQRRNTQAVRYTGLDELVQPGEIVAIEVYPRPSQVPPQFQRGGTTLRSGSGSNMETRNVDCGALVIWTRNAQ